MAATGNASSVATLERKELGGSNMPASQVTLHPDCRQVELAVQPAGVSVVCRDSGTLLAPFKGAVNGYVHVYNRRGSTVRIGECNATTLLYLVFANGDDHIARAQMAFDDRSFVSLSSLNALVFDNVNFVKPRFEATVPSSLARLNFRDVQFTTLPPVLYERRYSRPLSVNKLSVTPDSNVLKLSADFYDNAVANLNVSTLSQTANIDFLGGCNDKMKTQADIERLRVPASQLTVGSEISQGAFGRVYRGSFQGEKVAVKRLAPHRRKDLKQFLSFVDEAKLMASMRHARIIRFVGIAWTSPFDLHVVTEYMDGGDLRGLMIQYQEQRRATGFSRDKLKIALHVAEGLAYMHALRPQVLHRDLKSRNVLLTPELDAKLIDFGVARERADHTMTVGVGTLRWMAPEVMSGGHYTETADVFSFGVLHRDLKSRNVLLTPELDAKLIDFGVARERADHTMTVGVGTLRRRTCFRSA
ncbi:hypothetical protein P43SY_006253 [Pythium insidiosum]|uniref:Protein kinase domain-containing protein n=1 Tax=Pythium insidiosum TaxID=114742 RepID=A0AAD5L8X8_PYTIN|nr:hypothetical protein P43SY_006253 [Pythium insidiosum]